MLSYLYWQFVLAPAWLVRTFWNLELALVQFFSVGFLLKTLFAHWHRDVVRYDRSSFSAIFISFAWNQISRAIGFVVRASVLSAWLFVQVVYLVFALGFLVLFLAAPFLIALGFLTGLQLLL